MKSLKAQLIAAIAMTLVAALTIGSSTYAWFTMNTQVSATGMEIKANAGTTLLIAKGETKGTKPADSNFIAEIDISPTTKPVSLSPCSSIDLTTFYTARAGSATSYKASGSYSTTTTAYVEQPIWLKSGQDCNATLSSITVSGLPTGISGEVGKMGNSMRIGVYLPAVGEETAATFRIYAYDASSAGETTVSTTNKAGYGSNGTQRSEISDINFVAMQSTAGDSNNKWIPLTTDTAREMYVYFWFEGEDLACYTNNIDTTGMKISFTFTTDAT